MTLTLILSVTIFFEVIFVVVCILFLFVIVVNLLDLLGSLQKFQREIILNTEGSLLATTEIQLGKPTS